MPLYPNTQNGGGEPSLPGFDRANIAHQILMDCPEVYFRFDELSGTVAIDHSGFNRNGTYGATAQLGRDPISTAAHSCYDPQLSFAFPLYPRQDGAGNTTVRQDFSAVALVKILPQTTNGIFFNAGNNSSGVSVGKGSGSNPGSSGVDLVSLVNYVTYVDPNVRLSQGVNLIGIAVRARDNLIVYYLNGVPVYQTIQISRTLEGQGTVGFYQGDGFPHAVCDYGEFAFFHYELPPSRFAAYWKAVQLSS